MNNLIFLERLRKKYWNLTNTVSKIRYMFNRQNHPFAREVLTSHFRHLFNGTIPVEGNNRQAADAAVIWLLRAQAATPDNGVSYGYFPCHWDFGWRPSYPETTGYIIPTLLEYARRYNEPHIRDSALSMASWECEIQMGNGAVQAGPLCRPSEQRVAIFNTGMVLQGLTAAWRETRNPHFFASGRRAADFLISDIDKNGHFKTHGNFVVQDQIKTYNVLCSWALYCFGEDSNENIYKEAAIRNGEAALMEQQENGWFDNCCLTNPQSPLTHTLAYTLQGLLELGVLSGRKDFIEAVEKTMVQIMKNITSKGYLPSMFDQTWKPKGKFSCLTGSAQMAIVLYRLFELKNDQKYLNAADRLVDFLKALQRHDSNDNNLNGALAGSFPIMGAYMSTGYPNWATKYFLDAVLLQKKLNQF